MTAHDAGVDRPACTRQIVRILHLPRDREHHLLLAQAPRLARPCAHAL